MLSNKINFGITISFSVKIRLSLNIKNIPFFKRLRKTGYTQYFFLWGYVTEVHNGCYLCEVHFKTKKTRMRCSQEQPPTILVAARQAVCLDILNAATTSRWSLECTFTLKFNDLYIVLLNQTFLPFLYLELYYYESAATRPRSSNFQVDSEPQEKQKHTEHQFRVTDHQSNKLSQPSLLNPADELARFQPFDHRSPSSTVS